MILNSVIFDVQKKHDENVKYCKNIIYNCTSLTPAVFNLKIHLVKTPEAAAPGMAPEMDTAPPPCVKYSMRTRTNQEKE
jgi:hypothetical protein